MKFTISGSKKVRFINVPIEELILKEDGYFYSLLLSCFERESVTLLHTCSNKFLTSIFSNLNINSCPCHLNDSHGPRQAVFFNRLKSSVESRLHFRSIACCNNCDKTNIHPNVRSQLSILPTSIPQDFELIL